MVALASLAVDGERVARERRVVMRSFERLYSEDTRISLERPGDPGRAELERFITERFAAVHGARVVGFLPLLLGFWSGSVCRAALGIRPARADALFLEQYLDQPAEQVIAGICRVPVARATVVEIGNLVAAPGASTPLLYLLLLALLDRAGYRWLMFTATPEVHHGIRTLGFEIMPVCAADPGRLADASGWGSYYDSNPQVMLGCVEDGMRRSAADPRASALLRRADALIDELASRLRGA